ncbi:hypothetical protein, partial [Streptomyces sp. NPDC051098]|uniref:hypothetical protein n=1 Tax=Streptomyces sp. NPDC051098 TaxID=3155411 RepID=UPI003443EE8D
WSRFAKVTALAREHGAALIALTIDEEGGGTGQGGQSRQSGQSRQGASVRQGGQARQGQAGGQAAGRQRGTAQSSRRRAA